jgi:hypothetical protein
MQRHLEGLSALAAAEDEHAPREVYVVDPQKPHASVARGRGL